MFQWKMVQRIMKAKSLSAKVRELVRQCGQRDEQMPLTHRYSEAMSAPVDLSNATAADHQRKLMRAARDLMQLLEQEFLT